MPPHESVWTVLVAGGSGRRFGAPKQFERLDVPVDDVMDHRPTRVIDVAAATARTASDGVVVVAPASHAAAEGAVIGGATRSDSVRAGLSAVPDTATIVCVHDAARPFASARLFAAVIDAVRAGADGAVPGVPVTDTVKVVDGEPGDGTRAVLDTPDRVRLVAVQTPQAFRADVLRAAHAAGDDGTDDASLVERAGGRVVVVPGEPGNRKITLPEDLAWARGVWASTGAAAT